MDLNRKKIWIVMGLIVFGTINLDAADPAEKERITLPAAEVADKIRGGLLGQILGNLNGLPHEWKYIEEHGNVKNYIPSLPDGAWTDDDTDFEWVYVCQMQKNRNAFLSREAVHVLWKERINKRIWCSNRYARHLMDLGIQPPYTGYRSLNPWAGFNISGQFLCETFGLMAPAMPQTAARIGLNYTTVAIDGEPAQTTQLFTTMIATAFIEKDIRKILEAGVRSLDKTSAILQVVEDVKRWHDTNPDNWRETRRLLKEKYTQEGGRIRDTNGFELNTGSIIAALLYGQGDFSESLKVAFNFGWDADCNAATVGTIVGVTWGYRKMLNRSDTYDQDWQIVDRYRNVTRDNMPMDETITSFADRVIELFELVNEENGGRKTLAGNTVVYEIPSEKPAPVISLSSVEAQKKQLKNELEGRIVRGLLKGNRAERARAAYMAVCLELDAVLAEKHPQPWREACLELSGYWKVMHNIFYVKRPGNEFEALAELRGKFEQAGFRAPKKGYSDHELYTDTEVWKNPENLY